MGERAKAGKYEALKKRFKAFDYSRNSSSFLTARMQGWCLMEIMNNKNNLYLVIGLLLVLVAGLGVYAYREHNKPQGLEIRIDKNGLKVEGN
jgi:hypothetical protein